MSSILTNIGAMSALQTMQKTSSSLTVTQNRVGTGLKVYDASQNAARWAVGSEMKADRSAFEAIYDTHMTARAGVDVALKALNEMATIMETVKGKAVELDAASGDAATALTAEIASLTAAANAIASGATFNGVSMLGGGRLEVSTNQSGGSFSTTAATATGLTAPTTGATAQTALDTIATAARTLGADAQRLESYAKFAKAMEKGLQAGHGALLDADMGEESARLSALQTQQQLAAQALSIANQSAQVILGAFR